MKQYGLYGGLRQYRGLDVGVAQLTGVRSINSESCINNNIKVVLANVLH